MGSMLGAALRWRSRTTVVGMPKELDVIFCSLVKSTLLMSRRVQNRDFDKINGNTHSSSNSGGGGERTLPETLGSLITSMPLLDRFGRDETAITTFQGGSQLDNVLDDWLPLL